MTRQATDQLYIDLGYLTPEEYYVYIAESQSAQQATVTVTATLSHLQGADMFAFTNAELNAQAEVIRSANAGLVAEATQTSTVSRIRDIASSMAVESTLVAEAGFGFIEGSADLVAEALMAIQIDRIRETNVTLASQFDLATDYVKLVSGDSFSQALFSLDAINQRDRAFNIETQVAFSLSADITKIVGFSSNLNSEFNIGHTNQGAFVPNIRPNAIFDIEGNEPLVSTSALQSTPGFRRTANSAISSYFGVFAKGTERYERPLQLRSQISSIFDTNSKFGSHSASTFGDGSRTFYASDELVKKSNEYFLLEGWFYQTNVISADSNIVKYTDGTITPWAFISNFGNSANQFQFQVRYSNQTQTYTTTTNTPLNQWNHVAVVVTNTRLSIFLNGSRVYFNNTIPSPDWISTQTGRGDLVIGPYGSAEVDELRCICATGVQIYDPNATTITVPTAPFANTEQTQFLFHFDNNNIDDTSLVKSASADLITEALVQATLGGPQSGSATINATASMVCNVSKLVEINLIAFDNARLQATAFKIHLGASDLSEISILTSNAVKTVDAEANIDGVFADSILIVKTVDADIALTAGFSLTADAAVSASVDMDAVVSIQITTQAAKIASTPVNIGSTAAIVAHPTMVNQGNAAITAAMNFAITFSVVHIDEYVYVIPREIREWTISAEDRYKIIDREDRNIIIRR